VLWLLFSEPREDAVRRVFLFPRRLAVLLQNPVDDLLQWPQPGVLPIHLLSFRRDRAVDRLPHHSAMHPVLRRQSPNRLSGRVPAPDLFKYFHFLPPVHAGIFSFRAVQVGPN
jgi:hypothetical protein